MNWSIVRRGKKINHQGNDFSCHQRSSAIDTMPQVKVYNSFVSMADDTKAALDNFLKSGNGGDFIQVLGFIWSASKWFDMNAGASIKDTEYNNSTVDIELNLRDIAQPADLDRLPKKGIVKDNYIDGTSLVSKVLYIFSSMMDYERSISNSSEESSLMVHLIQGTGCCSQFIHKSHTKLYIGLKKLAMFVNESNDCANWEYLFPFVEDALDSMLWFSFCKTFNVEPTPNFKNWIDSQIHCTLLHVWVYQSSRCPHFTRDYLEAYVESIQEHLIWLLQERHCFLAEQAKDQINNMQDLLRLVLSLFNLTPEHETDRIILSHTQTYVNPALVKLGASIHSFTLKEVDGENMKTFETDWLTRIFQALFLPLDSDCLLSSEALIQYAHYYRHYLLRMPTHGNVDQINPLEEELGLVARVVFYEWSENHIEREILLNSRVEMVGLLRGLGSIICSSLNNEVPVELNPGLPDLLARFENVNVQLVRKVYHQIVNDLRPKTPKPNLLVFLNSVLKDLEEIRTCKFDSEHLKDQLQTIQRDFLVFISYVQNLEGNSIKYDSSQDLTVRITNATYDAEYIINAFATEAFHVCCRSFLISDILKRFNLIKESIFNGSSDVLLPTAKLQTDYMNISSRASVPPTDVFVGFEVEIKLLMERLASDRKKLDVIPVVGMPGLGKTTLAKRVYEDPYMDNHFQLRAWCCVSQDYAKEDLLLCILGSDGNRQCSSEDLSLMVHKKLKGRKYLIVLDDIWDVDVYYYLKRSLPDDCNGSRIVLTSRIKSIGDLSDPLELKLLTADVSWELLEKKVYLKDECPLELREIGMKISKKCGGLPLAVVVVAGILSNLEKGENAWKEVSEKLHIYTYGDCERQRMKALDLSYEFLPDHLKPLFLYLGAFPEDSNIRMSKLTRLWIGEGFIKMSGKRSLEAEAETYLMDLIDRSLVMVGERKSDGSVKSCRLHDLIRDMCIDKAKAEDFMEHTTRSGKKENIAEYLIYQRRASVSVKSCRLHDLIRDMCIGKAKGKDFMAHTTTGGKKENIAEHLIYQRRASVSVRSNPSTSTADGTPPRPRITHDDLSRLSIPTRLNSLLLFGGGYGEGVVISDIVGDESAFENHKMLKVFDAGRFEIPKDWLSTITLPMNLRYFVCENVIIVRGSIPSSVFSLWKLETLVIGGNSVVKVPGEVWKMAKLRHLHIGSYYHGFRFSDAAGEECCVDKLENLQTLSWPVFFIGEDTTALLTGRFPNLVKLKCIFDNMSRDDKKKSGRWPRLESLHQLQSLNVQWRGGKCKQPQFMSVFPSSLKKLTLSWFELKWKDISNLQQVLPNLQILKLRLKAVEDELWDMEDVVFPKLKFLKLHGLNIKRWIASAENFPCLQSLVLKSCDDLEEIPSSFGEIYSLEKIQLVGCSHSASESAKRIETEQIEDYGNDLLKVYVTHPRLPKGSRFSFKFHGCSLPIHINPFSSGNTSKSSFFTLPVSFSRHKLQAYNHREKLKNG